MQNISVERLREVLDYDPETGIFVWKVRLSRKCRVGTRAGHFHRQGYRVITIERANFMAHRLAWLYVTGAWPSNHIDHIDGNPDNNSWGNLRDVGHEINRQNIRKPYRSNTSGYLGVNWHAICNKWRAAIRLNGKGYHLGLFDDPAKAHEAYLEAKRKMHIGCTI